MVLVVLDGAGGREEEVGEEGFRGVERPRAVREGLGLGDVVAAAAVLEEVLWRVVGGGVLFL